VRQQHEGTGLQPGLARTVDGETAASGEHDVERRRRAFRDRESPRSAEAREAEERAVNAHRTEELADRVVAAVVAQSPHRKPLGVSIKDPGARAIVSARPAA
jgi:hypothetical protein